MPVTAIVSAYFAEDWLENRLRNLEQQVPAPEIVVVAQRDSTEAGIAQHHDCMWILTDGIPTIYAAWNIGIRAANNEYLTNANCDDEAYPGIYAEMEHILDEHPEIALVYGDNDVTDGLNKGVHHRMVGGYELLQKYCYVGPFPMWRKSLHVQYGLFDERYQVCGDYEFWLRVSSHGELFYHMNKSVGLYRVRANSAEHRDRTIAQTENACVKRLYGGVHVQR